jgi:O-antigen ligase
MIHLIGRICVWSIAFLSPWATYTQLGFFLTPITIAGTVLFIVYLLDRLVASDFHFRKSSAILFLYSAFLVFSTVWSIDTSASGNYTFWWSICMGSYLGTRRFIQTRKHLNTTLIFMCASLIPTYLLLQEVEFTFMSSGRAAVPGHNSNFTAYTVAGVFLGIIMFVYASWLSIHKKMLLAFFTVFAPFVVLQLGTRGALLSIYFVLLAFLTVRFLPRRAVLVVLWAACVIAVGVTFGVADVVLFAVDYFSLRSNGNLSGREELWQLAIGRFYDSPLIGNGFSSSSKLGENNLGAHNFFLIVLSETGLAGMALVAAFIFAWAKEIRKCGEQGLKILLLFAAYWFPIATSGIWELTPYSWFIVGLTSQVAALYPPQKMADVAKISSNIKSYPRDEVG